MDAVHGLMPSCCMQALAAELLGDCHLECLLHGNLTAEEAVSLASSMRTQLGGGCMLPAAERPRDRCVELPSGSALLHRLPAKNAEEDNCAVEAYYQVSSPAATAETLSRHCRRFAI